MLKKTISFIILNLILINNLNAHFPIPQQKLRLNSPRDQLELHKHKTMPTSEAATGVIDDIKYLAKRHFLILAIITEGKGGIPEKWHIQKRKRYDLGDTNHPTEWYEKNYDEKTDQSEHSYFKNNPPAKDTIIIVKQEKINANLIEIGPLQFIISESPLLYKKRQYLETVETSSSTQPNPDQLAADKSADIDSHSSESLQTPTSSLVEASKHNSDLQFEKQGLYWQVILDYEIPLAINLVSEEDLVQHSKHLTTNRHYPQPDNQYLHFNSTGVIVEYVGVGVGVGSQDNIEQHKLKIICTADHPHTVHPLEINHITNWKDGYSLPISDPLEQLLSKTQQHALKKPVIVNCLAGLGRSATFVAMVILKSWHEVLPVYDLEAIVTRVHDTVIWLRLKRSFLAIISKEQLALLYNYQFILSNLTLVKALNTESDSDSDSSLSDSDSDY